MDEMIVERKEEFEIDPEGASKRGDLLTNLIAAAASEDQADEKGAEEAASLPDTSASGKKKKKGLSLDQDELRG